MLRFTLVGVGMVSIGASASAQTRTRSLREGAGARPAPSAEGRREGNPYPQTQRGTGREEPADRTVPESEEVGGGLSMSGESAPAVPTREPYRGVSPDNKTAPPHAPHSKSPVALTWTGFQMKPEGGSRVFLQLTGQAQYEVTDVPAGVRVTIHGARLHLRNNGRTLDTRFFSTPVKLVKVSERRGEITIEIEMRGKAAHSEKLEPQSGYQFLMIDFPAGGTSESATK